MSEKGIEALHRLESLGFSVAIKNGRLDVVSRDKSAAPRELLEAIKADRASVTAYIRERLRSIQRREDTLGSFQRFFERGQYDPGASRQFLREITRRRDDDSDGDGRIA